MSLRWLHSLIPPALAILLALAHGATQAQVVPTTATSREGDSLLLPLEVLGNPGHIKTIQVDVPKGASATDLYLQIHGLGYEGKASVRLNQGPWLTLNNQNVTYPKLERGFWGMGGPLSTLRMTVPTTNWAQFDGPNEIQFRFNDADGRSVGYRILALNLRHGTKDLIPTDAFTYDDPAKWTGPSTKASDIEAGRVAWHTLELVERGHKLRAHCADCHAYDGRDLKYFNYSNQSIIERSRFHGATDTIAIQIASYLRSLRIPYEAGARPWNPPYQPGPGLDSQPVRSWAAGAGLPAVLDNDLETLNYLFPDGITTNGLDLRKTVNAREIPLAVQFPDWNRWLPKVHPLDQYPSIYATNLYVAFYQTLRTQMTNKSGLRAAEYFESKKNLWDSYAGTTGIKKPPTTDPNYPLWAENERDKRHWRVVKTWEFMTGWEIEDYGDDTSIFPSVPNAAPLNKRRWFHGEVFRLSPHVVGTRRYPGWAAESMVWYQLQLVLNDGNRKNGSIVPIDWGYQHALNQTAWQNPAGLTTYGITILNIIKALEVGYNGIPLSKAHSFNPMKADTYLLQSQYRRRLYQTIPVKLRKAVAEAVLARWLDQLESYTPAELRSAQYPFKGLSDRLNNHLEWFPTINVDPNFLNRIRALKANRLE